MDREDLTFAAVALEARVRELGPALDVLAATEADRLRLVAEIFRKQHQGYEPAMRAADQLEEIAMWGSGVLKLPIRPEMLDFCQVLRKLIGEKPMNRAQRRSEEREERHKRRMVRNEKLRDMAIAYEGVAHGGSN